MLYCEVVTILECEANRLFCEATMQVDDDDGCDSLIIYYEAI